LKLAAYYYKLSADQGRPSGQFNDADCREKGRGVAMDLILAEQYYKFAAEHEDAAFESWFANCLLTIGDQPPSVTLVPYLTIAAEAKSRRAHLNLVDLCESDPSQPIDRSLAAYYAEISARFSPVGCAYYGWLLQNGIGVPINFTESYEFFQIAANGGNADGANCLALCLDQGIGIDKDPARAAVYYRFAASQKHSAGLNNFGRCLEYGQGVERNLLRAAKYY
jgi:TPR repeat protein